KGAGWTGVLASDFRPLITDLCSSALPFSLSTRLPFLWPGFVRPFLGETLGVFLHHRRVINVAVAEGDASEVMHETAARDRGAVAGLDGALAVIIVVVAAPPEALVQVADFIDHFLADEQAEADQAVDQHQSIGLGLTPAPGEGV